MLVRLKVAVSTLLVLAIWFSQLLPVGAQVLKPSQEAMDELMSGEKSVYARKAAVAWRDHNASEALQLIDSAIASNPRSVRLRIAKAIMLQYDGKTEAAVQLLRELTLHCDRSEAIKLRAMRLSQMGLFAQAITDYDSLTASQRHDPKVLSNMAECLMWQGNDKRAMQAVTAYQRSFGKRQDPMPLVVQGVVESANGANREAIAHFARAIKYDSNCGLAFLGRGHALQAAGRSKQAELDLKQARKLHLDNYEWYRLQHGRASATHNWRKMFECSTCMLTARPGDKRALMMRARASRRLGKKEQWLKDAAAMCTWPSKSCNYHLQAGQWFLEAGDSKKARKIVDDVLIHFPESAPAYILRAKCKEKDEEFELALADLDKAIVLSPQDAIARLEKGKFQYKRVQLKSAQADLTRAIELDPKLMPAYFWRAKVYDELKNPQLAGRDRETLNRAAGVRR